jgi:ribosomal protein S12 methylthiotransferase accessory factor
MEMVVTFPGGAKVKAQYKGFTIMTDQPPEDGGEGAFPTPFDLFFASLATCAGIYVLRFLQARDIPSSEAKVVLQVKGHDADRKLVTHLELRVILPPQFPGEYREAIIRAIDSCTVKRHLKEPPRIDTVTEVAGGD